MANLKYELNQHMGPWVWSTECFERKILLPETDSNDCHEWIGSNGPNGPLFGIYKLNEQGKRIPRMVPARRVLFAEHNGYWPDDNTSVYHGCGNRNCMNPHHLTNTRPPEAVYKNYRAQHGE